LSAFFKSWLTIAVMIPTAAILKMMSMLIRYNV
jgi:hypothetical protein